MLQGCILSSHARIEDRVSLKDCQVGSNFTVTREGKSIYYSQHYYVCYYYFFFPSADLKGEALVVGGGMDF